MKKLRIFAVIAALAACGTMAMAGCNSQSDMTDEDLADLKAAAAATCAYSGSYGYDSTYKFAMSGGDDGGAASMTTGIALKFTYDRVSGCMGYYNEQTYSMSSAALSYNETAAYGDYIVPDGDTFSEYVYLKENDLYGVVTIITYRYDYDSLAEMESAHYGTINSGYSDYMQLKNVLDDFDGPDLSDLTEINSVEEIKTSITEELQGEFYVGAEDLTADCLVGEEGGSRYYTIKVSGSMEEGGITAAMSIAVTYYTDGGYIRKVATTADMRYKESESAEETVMTTEGVYNISYSYDSGVIPSDAELELYAKRN